MNNDKPVTEASTPSVFDTVYSSKSCYYVLLERTNPCHAPDAILCDKLECDEILMLE